MLDDLKALRDEIRDSGKQAAMADWDGIAGTFEGWAARLTSIIERQEKERAESESFCKGHSDGNSRIEGYAALVQCPNCGVVHSALTERAKP